MEKEKIIKITIVFLAVVVLILAGLCVFYKVQLTKTQNLVMAQQINKKNLDFANLFADKFLTGSKEISFEDRLKIENAVRDINDQQIFTAWQAFSKSQTQADAQKSFGDLLILILKKISY